MVFDLTGKPSYHYRLQDSPPRLIIELTDTQSRVQAEGLKKTGPMISRLSQQAAAGTLRWQFELTGQIKPTLFTLKPQAQYGHRLVVDLPHAGQSVAATGGSSSKAAGQGAPVRSAKPLMAGKITPVSELEGLPRQPTVTDKPAATMSPAVPAQTAAAPAKPMAAEVTKPAPAKVSTLSGEEIIVAVDAGHGGKDPGAVGPHGSYEKNVTLAVARDLAALINRQPGMRAVMTRTGDYFVDLNQRSEIARKHKAHLLISVHADSVANRQARGASVWILSAKRVDREMNKLLGQQDKHTELLGGAGKVIAEAEPNPYLAQTILDLSWDNSRSEGYSIGEMVLKHIGQEVRLHKHQPQHASLAVLKAPDIPSLLIETGFISNPQEEKLLTSSAFQQRVARAIFNGINRYYADNPPDGTMLANRAKGQTRHVVKSGESLARLAKQYGVSMARLRNHNSLKSDQLRIGQVIYIPTS
ncbi:hypothetical protein GCM10023095_20110 [Pseudaeromonas paramecii]|uniref:N-acetylmuramoyl-L-alanine amidase n=1 Tax=Pseudaeromonas paramecii TaxID=2138166 RepID=A0ABP8QDI7_9GAMM